jgi:hypothetical protein
MLLCCGFQEISLGIVEGASCKGELVHDAERKKMEILIFALIASYSALRQKESVIAEPEDFQPFDLQALRNPTNNKPSRSSRQRVAYLPRTA